MINWDEIRDENEIAEDGFLPEDSLTVEDLEIWEAVTNRMGIDFYSEFEDCSISDRTDDMREFHHTKLDLEQFGSIVHAVMQR